MKKVAVIILNYKVKDLTLNCIKSIQSSTYKNVSIIVVDNNSEDSLEEDLIKSKEIKFIQTGANLGYTGGNNIGIREALKEDSDYLFVINPDAYVARNAIANLVTAAEKGTKVGVVGPKILFDDKETIWYAGGFFDKSNVLGGHRGVDEKDSGQYEKEEETDNVTGGAILIRREVLEKIGLFDERYFLYYEDSDFCLRAKQAGFKLIYAPKAVVYHKNAKSAGLGTPLQDYFITRNRMLLASKILPFRTRFALLREAIKNIFIPARRLALFDFLTGNFGKGSFLK